MNQTLRSNRRRRAGRRARRSDAAHSPRPNRTGESRELLTGHGQTVLSQRLRALRRQLAAVAWRHQEIEHGQHLGSETEREELSRQAVGLGLEINQLEAMLELAEFPELEIGDVIGPGTAIDVIDAASGEPAEYRLVGCEWDSDSTVVTLGSPIGQALAGRRLGSLVTLNHPGGLRRVRVVSARPIGASGLDPGSR